MFDCHNVNDIGNTSYISVKVYDKTISSAQMSIYMKQVICTNAGKLMK